MKRASTHLAGVLAVLVLAAPPALASPTTIPTVLIEAEPAIVSVQLQPGEAVAGSIVVTITEVVSTHFTLSTSDGFLIHLSRHGETAGFGQVNSTGGSVSCREASPCSLVFDYRVDPLFPVAPDTPLTITARSSAYVDEAQAAAWSVQLEAGQANVVEAGFVESVAYDVEIGPQETHPGIFAKWDLRSLPASWELLHADRGSPEFTRTTVVRTNRSGPCRGAECVGSAAIASPPSGAGRLRGELIVWSMQRPEDGSADLQVAPGVASTLAGTITLDETAPDLLVPVTFDRVPRHVSFELTSQTTIVAGENNHRMSAGLGAPGQEREWGSRQKVLRFEDYEGSAIDLAFSSQAAFQALTTLQVDWQLTASVNPFDAHGPVALELVAGPSTRVDFAPNEQGDPSRPMYTDSPRIGAIGIAALAIGGLVTAWLIAAYSRERRRRHDSRGPERRAH